MSKYVRVLSVAVLFLVVGAVDNVFAYAVRSGATTMAIAALSRGTAVAYDSTSKVYLVVGASGIVYGRFVSADGTPLGAPFQIQASVTYTHFPRVAFSPDADGGAGAFLVTWSESDLPAFGTSVHARLVSYTKGGPIGNDNRIGNFPKFECGNGVAYATGSKEFLVVWKNYATNDVAAARVDNNGNAIAAVAVPATPDGESDVNVAYNPNTDQFLVVYNGYNNATAFVGARRVQAGTGAVLDANRINVADAAGTYITDVSFNPATNQFLASWFALPANAMFGRLVNADGSLGSGVITLSARYKAYDALSVAYNRQSNTFLMTTHSDTAEDAAVEINANGTPVDNGFVATAIGGKGNFYPRVAASSDQPNWLMSTANNFTSTMVQLVTGTASTNAPDPGPSPTPTPAPTPTPQAPTPKPGMNIDSPGANSNVASNAFLVSGWALDLGAASGSGVDVVQAWAYPSNGAAPTFVGTATYGIARPDLAAYVGAQFTNCGYTLVGSLPPGVYDVMVFAHSTVSGTFNNVKGVRVTVQAAVSNPRMWLDTPSPNQTTSQNLSIAGWALDLGSATGTGVDTVHVWAYPNSGATPIWVGVANYGNIQRPDVAAYAGASRFTPSGFTVSGTLPPGDYNMVAFAHSTVTNTFNSVVQVPIKVR